MTLCLDSAYNIRYCSTLQEVALVAEPKKSFFQRHPGFDLYSLFWFLLFLILAALGRFFLPLWIPWCWCTC